MVLSDAVINDTYNILMYRLGFHVAYNFLRKALAGDPFVIVDVTTPIRTTTFGMIEKYNDHKISYCDALSVAMMED